MERVSRFDQRIVVMRHGDRIDNFDPLWITTAARPWDPPLVDQGRARAFSTGRRLRDSLGYPIHRIFVSPFLRCVQTAAEVVSSLCAVGDGPNDVASSERVTIDPSRVKVSIEYGLCEMLNKEAIRFDVAPKDGKFSFDISELEAMLPAGTVDRSVSPVYQKLPEWEEENARGRYTYVIRALADKYPSENLLLITHGEGVGTSVSSFLEGVTVYEAEYCAYSELGRFVVLDEAFKAGELEVLTASGQTGIKYATLK